MYFRGCGRVQLKEVAPAAGGLDRKDRKETDDFFLHLACCGTLMSLALPLMPLLLYNSANFGIDQIASEYRVSVDTNTNTSNL